MEVPMRVLRSVVVGMFVAASAHAEPDRYLMVRGGTVLAVPGKAPIRDATVVVKNGKVDAVVPTAQEPRREWLPKDAVVEEVDATGMWVLPGLIDCHVHLSMEIDEKVRERAVSESDELTTVRAIGHAKTTLHAGFTTVRDLGAASEVIFAVRDGVNMGLIEGPRIVASGRSVSVTGGHGDRTNGYRADVWPMPTEAQGIADGPDACMKAVRSLVKQGADVIKLTATGGVLSASAAGLRQHFTQEELSAIVTAAHMMGRRVAAHAHGTDGIKAALIAGVDSIEHGTYLDEETIGMLRTTNGGPDGKGVKRYLVPTMLAAETVGANAEKPGYYLPMVAAKARLVGPKLKEAVKKAHAAGVLIAFGTDSGVSVHGLNAREFVLLVEAGMTPTEAIVSATVRAAELLGLENEIGTLEAGKAGDLIVVAGDPTKDVGVLMEVNVVVKAGKVVKGRD
jgi:imidazolonepropionase-like amidohydrolase